MIFGCDIHILSIFSFRNFDCAVVLQMLCSIRFHRLWMSLRHQNQSLAITSFGATAFAKIWSLLWCRICKYLATFAVPHLQTFDRFWDKCLLSGVDFYEPLATFSILLLQIFGNFCEQRWDLIPFLSYLFKNWYIKF